MFVTEAAIIGSIFIYLRRRFRDMRKFWRNFRRYRAIISENYKLKEENERLWAWRNDITVRLLRTKQKQNQIYQVQKDIDTELHGTE